MGDEPRRVLRATGELMAEFYCIAATRALTHDERIRVIESVLMQVKSDAASAMIAENAAREGSEETGKCSRCEGHGNMGMGPESRRRVIAQLSRGGGARNCRRCGGHGYRCFADGPGEPIQLSKCKTCNGSGHVAREEER